MLAHIFCFLVQCCYETWHLIVHPFGLLHSGETRVEHSDTVSEEDTGQSQPKLVAEMAASGDSRAKLFFLAHCKWNVCTCMVVVPMSWSFPDTTD